MEDSLSTEDKMDPRNWFQKFIDGLGKIMFWIANTLQFIFCLIWNYPKLWIHTSIIRRRVKEGEDKKEVVVVGADMVQVAIARASNSNVQCRIELPDARYVLPKLEWIQYIFDNLWEPYKKVHKLIYNSDYDCDNFAMSLANLIQELELGLCIGFVHMGFVGAGGKYVGHAVNCFVPSNTAQANVVLHLMEPQADKFGDEPLADGSKDLFFAYLEGREAFK